MWIEFEKHKILLKDLMREFQKDFRIIEVVRDIEETIGLCRKEIDRRNNFWLVLRSVLELLSEVIIHENKLRYEFLKENAKKIPNELLPSLKTLCKNINLHKM